MAIRWRRIALGICVVAGVLAAIVAGRKPRSSAPSDAVATAAADATWALGDEESVSRQAALFAQAHPPAAGQR